MSKIINWIKNREPVATFAVVTAAVAVAAQAVSALPTDATWAAVAAAAFMALTRFFVTPSGGA
jgi:hypothetical protein